MSSPRERRLIADAAAVAEQFADHPHITIRPLSGTPPDAYSVTYQLRGLSRDGDSAVISTTHDCEVRLGLDYPRGAPYVAALTPQFHPNVAGHFCIGDYWSPAQPLTDVIVKVGEMIQWKTYSIEGALNPEAAAYASANPTIFPIGTVELGHGGGDALD
jgi:ubiquitin-protein ligase